MNENSRKFTKMILIKTSGANNVNMVAVLSDVAYLYINGFPYLRPARPEVK